VNKRNKNESKVNLIADMKRMERDDDTYTPGAEGRGRSDGIEPPWKSFSVMVLPLTFFFDILPLLTLPHQKFKKN
jgi:hypothetical protein